MMTRFPHPKTQQSNGNSSLAHQGPRTLHTPAWKVEKTEDIKGRKETQFVPFLMLPRLPSIKDSPSQQAVEAIVFFSFVRMLPDSSLRGKKEQLS